MRTVFIIEDDPVVLHVYKTQLEKAGFHVMTATNGEESFYLLLHKSSPDAILLDLMLPKINGVDVLKTIRAQRKFEKTPIFVFTSNDLSDLAKEALNAGADQIFDKSKIAPADIVDAIRESLAASVQSLPPLQGEEPTRDIIDKAPETVAGLCKSLQALSKTENPQDRLAQLTHLHEKVQDLSVQATAAGLRAAAQMAAALESLLKQLSENLTEINASNLRTISHGIDFLGVLFQQSSRSALALTTPIKVLVVDDDEISRMAIMRALEKANLDSVSFGNPQEALTTLEDNSFDLIFLDVSMPEISGFEVCLKLRKLPNHKATPVLFVTSLNDFASRSRSRLIGGSDLIAKPFLFTELSVKALTYAFKYRLLDHSVSIDSSLSANEPVQPNFQSGPKTPDRSISLLPPGDTARLPTPTEGRVIVREHDVDSSSVPAPAALPKFKEAPSQDSSSDSMSAPLTAVRGTVIDGVITLDENGIIKALNSVAARFFGYESTEITGKNISVLIPHVAQGTAPNLKTLSVDAAGTPHGAVLTGQRKDGSRVTFNFLLKEITVSGRRLFTGLIREQSARSQPRKSSLKMAKVAAPSNGGESLEIEDAPDHSKNGRLPAAIIPSNSATNAPVGIAPSAQIPARLDQDAAAREKLEARCSELSRIRSALEQDLARHQKVAQSSQESIGNLEASLREKTSELTRAQSECQKESTQRETLSARLTELSSTHSRVTGELKQQHEALQKVQQNLLVIEAQKRELHSNLQEQTSNSHKHFIELGEKVSGLEEKITQGKRVEHESQHREDELQAQLKKQVIERTNIQAKLESQLSELKCVEEARAKLSFSRDELAGELAERKRNEEQLRKEQAALESQIQDRTRQIDQLAIQLQKEVQHRQQAVDQAARLSKTQAAAEEQFAVHKQAEETWRTTQQKIAAEAKQQASQLTRVQDQLHKEGAERQQAQAQAAELVKAQSALQQELTQYHQSQEHWRATEQDLQSRLDKQTGELAQVRLQLQKEGEQRQQVQEQASSLTSTQTALAGQLEQHKQTEEALRLKSVDLQSQIQDRTRQIDQLAIQLQKEVQHRQQAVDQAARLSKTQAAAEEQFAVHKQAEETWRTTQQKIAAEAKQQASQLTRVQDQLHKESAERQQAQAQAADLAKAQSALQQELTQYHQSQEHWRAAEQDLQSRLDKQTGELAQVRLQLEKEGEQRQQVQEQASSLTSTQTALAGQLEQHKRTEGALRLKSVELESQIQDRTRQIDQLAIQLQKEVQHRQQAVDQAARLSKTQAAAEEQFAVHKQAEETWRTTQQKTEAEAKQQASQLTRVQDQLHKESAERQQAQAQAADLVKAQSALQQELTQYHQSQEHWRATEHDLQSRLDKQTGELAQVRLQLQKEGEQRQQVQEQASSLTSTQTALAGQLEQHKRTEEALRLKSVELESQIQDRTRQIDQLAIQLQEEVQHRQQAVDQAVQLSKTQAAAEEQFAVHKQAEETWRTMQQKTEAEARKQASQLTRVQDQLHKEGAERQQAQAQAADLVKAQSALQQELTQYHQSQEHWRATEHDLQSRLEKQTGELAQVRLQLQQEGEQRQQVQEQASSLTSTQTALAGQLEQHKRTEEALGLKSVELESQIQDRTRQIDQLAIQLQEEVQHRQQAVDQAAQLSKTQAAAEEQFAVHKQAEETWRTTQQKIAAEAKQQASQLIQVQDQLHKESAERQQAQAQAADLVKAQSALQQELTQYHQSQEHWRATEHDLQTRLEKQTGELAQVRLQLQQEWEQRLELQERASNLASTQSGLAGQLEQHKRTEGALRLKSVELESQIQDRTRQIDQLAIQLQKEVQLRQQAVDQAAQLSKTQAAAEERFAVHKQAEETWRTTQQKIEAEAKKQASQLIQVQDQLHKEKAERQQLAVLNDESSKREHVLKEEIGARKLVEEALSRAKESLETGLKEQSQELDNVRLGLKKQATELLQVRQKVSEFTNSEIALKQELNQRLQSDAQIEKEQAEMEIRLQTAARESEIARSELHQATHALLRAEAEMEQERYTGLESATAKLRLAEDLCSSLRETTSRIAAFSCRLLESNLTKEQHAVVTEMQAMGELVPPRGHLWEFSQGGVELADAGSSEFCLLKVVELAIEPFATESKKENIVIGSLVHQDVPALVTGCEGRLRRVLARFIDSSIQFTKAGSVIVSVTKESETQSQLVLKFSVKGGAHDLSEESQSQLLRACSQTAELGPANHTALELGLAAAKKLVKMMVGGFGIAITPTGTCLWCQLTFPKLLACFPSASTTAELGDLRVLVIEENEIKRGILQAQITASGMRNAGTNNGVEALSLLRQQISAGDPFKVAIISTGLQDLNALTLVKIFKGDPVLAATRLVILGEAAEAFNDAAYRKVQVFDFLTKPIRQSELLGLLNRIVSESTLNEAAAEPGLSRIESHE